MDKKLRNKLFIISSIGLLVAGAVFLGISIFDDSSDTGYLAAALGCIVLSNLFNLIRQMDNRDN